MSNRTNTLHLYHLDTMQDYIDMWEDLDLDYSKDTDIEEFIEFLDENMYHTSMADYYVKDLFDSYESTDEHRVQEFLGLIEKGFGSCFSQFKSSVIEHEDHTFSVAISYLD